MVTPITDELKELPQPLRRAFAPLRKRALGMATGLVTGGALFLLTAYHLVFEPSVPTHLLEGHPFEGDPVGHLWLLRQYFHGYDPVTWSGAAFGFVWGAAAGFVLGFGLAALRNGVVQAWLIVVRARGNLAANKGFLDQI
jgi:hypothetical protein